MSYRRTIPNIAYSFCLIDFLETLVSHKAPQTKKKESFSPSFKHEPIWVASIWYRVLFVCVCTRLKGQEQSILNGDVSGELYIYIHTHTYCIWDVLSFWTVKVSVQVCLLWVFYWHFHYIPPNTTFFQGLMTQNKHFLEVESGMLDVI